MSAPPTGALPPDQHAYALIDAAQVDRFHTRIASLRGASAVLTLMNSAPTPEQMNAMPQLLAMQPEEGFKKLVAAYTSDGLGAAMQFPGALSWLVSPLAPRELAERLRARLDAELPERFDCINRFFDARVVPHLHACLNAQQRQAFFSACSQWWVVSHEHRWQSLACEFAAEDPFAGPLKLTEQQQAYMVDACYPYTVIEHFMDSAPELLDPVPAAQRYGFMAQALRAAAGFGVDSGASAILFCTLALTRGSGFHEQSPWPALLERVKSGQISLQQAVKTRHD